MFRSILVPLDGSVFAEHALPLAVSVAKHCGATLRLLRVVPPLADYFFLPPLPTDPLHKELQDLHRKDACSYLESVTERLKDASPVKCDVMEEVDGVAESVCASVVKSGADLIVMSSHGRGAVARFWLGSIADQLIRTAPVPVLVARPPEQSPAVDFHHAVTLKHFVLALGGDADAERIIGPALTLGKAMNADYTLVSAVRPALTSMLSAATTDLGPKPAAGWTGLSKFDEQNCRQAEEYLNKVADRIRAGGASVQTRVHVAEQPATAILREASLVGADLIAMETHGRGATRLLIGSVADKVVRGSSIPVLVGRLPQQGA